MYAEPVTRDQDPTASATEPAGGPDGLIHTVRATLARVFGHRADDDLLGTERGLPPFVLRDVLSSRALTAFIPSRFGGFGDTAGTGQAILEEASYHSMALGLTMGINGALFVQPVAKYADPAVAAAVLRRIRDEGAMGGLMITEPSHGTDALGMQTGWQRDGDTITVTGTKHWAGLSGWADYWLVAARERDDAGDLRHGIDLLLCDQDEPKQHIRLADRYPALGLYGIPYGRNEVDVRIPANQKLGGRRAGLTMLLDVLHRSRAQFPGMAAGFLRRMTDEAVAHTRERMVSGRRLLDHDQVRARVSRIQGQWTTAAALCLWTSENVRPAADMSRSALPANAIKTVCTDFMQDAAQSLLQLVGGQGYRLNHIAGRAVVDSRPFQIFEGSNDVLYSQVGSTVGEQARRRESPTLRHVLAEDRTTAGGADELGSLLEVPVEEKSPQRQQVRLGAVASRVFALSAVQEMGRRGFGRDHIAAAAAALREDVTTLLARWRSRSGAEVAAEPTRSISWRRYLTDPDAADPVPQAGS